MSDFREALSTERLVDFTCNKIEFMTAVSFTAVHRLSLLEISQKRELQQSA